VGACPPVYVPTLVLGKTSVVTVGAWSSLGYILFHSLHLAMKQDPKVSKIFEISCSSFTRWASRPGWSIYLFLFCQTRHFRNDLSHFPCIKFHFDYLSYHQAGCLYCRHLHCSIALLEIFLFCEVVLLNTCPNTFLFFCSRLFCFSHLWLPIKYFWPMSPGLWLVFAEAFRKNQKIWKILKSVWGYICRIELLVLGKVCLHNGS